MKVALLAVALAAAWTGAWAAWLWYKASRVNVIPLWAVNGRMEPVDPQQATSEWIVAFLQTGQKASDLNRRAALWTAISVFLSGATTVAGMFAS